MKETTKDALALIVVVIAALIGVGAILWFLLLGGESEEPTMPAPAVAAPVDTTVASVDDVTPLTPDEWCWAFAGGFETHRWVTATDDEGNLVDEEYAALTRTQFEGLVLRCLERGMYQLPRDGWYVEESPVGGGGAPSTPR